MNINTAIYDDKVDRAAMTRLYQQGVTEKIELVLNGHVVRVDNLIKKSKNFNHFRELLEPELAKTVTKLTKTSGNSLLSLMKSQASYTGQLFEEKIGKIWKTERPSQKISEEFILKTPLYKNATLERGWSSIGMAERVRLEKVIRGGIAEGKSFDEMALMIRKGNVHNITRNQSRALVVTATTSVVAQADHAVYEANSGVLNGWQYVSVLDSRTTPICAGRDGKIFSVSNRSMLPPAHYQCRSVTTPVFKSWDTMNKSEALSQIKRRNMAKLTPEQIQYYDGLTPSRESYGVWLGRQSDTVKRKHLVTQERVDMFNSGQISVDKFVDLSGKKVGITTLRKLTDKTYNLPNDVKKFDLAKQKLDSMQLWATNPDDFLGNISLENQLREYYLLQAGDLSGNLSLTNYRGNLMGTKRSMKRRVLTSPPAEDSLKFNPITRRYEDPRLFQPAPGVFHNNLKLMRESEDLLDKDKVFIESFSNSLREKMSMNQRAVVVDNLRIVFGRQRKNKDVWLNFKAVSNAQMKFDVMNVSDAIETHLRKDSGLLKRLQQASFMDPVLGDISFDDIHDKFVTNILNRNRWELRTEPRIAKELSGVFDMRHVLKYNPLLYKNLDGRSVQQFYLRFARRLAQADMPDRDQLAVALGRDLYNVGNMNGTRKDWYSLGLQFVDDKKSKKFFEVETYGVQKRRMKSNRSGKYFGPYYDTLSYNLRITDPRILEYSALQRKIDLGLRVGALNEPKLIVREGYKTYFVKRGVLGLEDTGIPITSTSSFKDFPETFMDKDMVDALNWTASAKYRIDDKFYDFTNAMLKFEDDRGKAKHYNELNEFRKYMISRDDSYVRLKAMEWLREDNKAFSNYAFIDHRARIYDRGFIGPQSGEAYRPFLSTAAEANFSRKDFKNLQDHIGAFLGGHNDFFEGKFDSLTVTGRQGVARKWRSEMLEIGKAILSNRPRDLRAILNSEIVQHVDGEEIGKFYRLCMESAKIDNYLRTVAKKEKLLYHGSTLNKLGGYRTAFAVEQDASSSGAQIIALTTRNKQLAEMSNVVLTDQKRRLYDEIAAATFDDPRFIKLNQKLGLTEKDLRKAKLLAL